MPMEGWQGVQRLEMVFLLLSEGRRGLDEVQLKFGEKVGMVQGDGGKDVVSEVAAIGSLFDQVE